MTTDQPIEHVPGQQQLPVDPAPAPEPADPTAAGDTGSDDDGQGDDQGTPGVPYAPEYVVPDPGEQAALAAQVPDDPQPPTAEQLAAWSADPAVPADPAAVDGD